MNIDFSDGVPSGDCTDGLSFIRTWTASDFCGNIASCDQTVTIIDDIAPMLNCPADIEVSCNSSTEPNVTGMATAADACNTATVTHSDGPITGSCPQTFVRTFTAIDACGNMATCTQLITIIDDAPPVITCPVDITVSCENNNTDPAITGTATATDACSAVDVNFTDGPITGICPQTFVRTWTATDACGNTTSCLQTITIEDVNGPTIVCPANISVSCEASTAPSATGVATATDACGTCLLYTSPSPRDQRGSRMPSSA